MLTLISSSETRLHAVPAAPKLLVLCAATILIFQLNEPVALIDVLACVAAIYACLGRSFCRQGAAMLRPLLPFVLIVSIWHGWTGDIRGGLIVILRLAIAVGIANLVTMTTRLSDIIATVERLASPLSHIGLKPKVIAIGVALTMRFIPVLGQKIELIGFAWRARSARRRGWRILLPITLSVLDDAEHVADALRARGGIT